MTKPLVSWRRALLFVTISLCVSSTTARRATLAAGASPSWVSGAKPRSEELAMCAQWTRENFRHPREAKSPAQESGHRPQVVHRPFSFVYAGRSSAEWLGAWKCQEKVQQLDAARTRRTQTFTDPATGLCVRCILVEYKDFPVVEWTLYFKNTGSKATPLLENIEALDTRFRRGPAPEFLLHRNVGSPCEARDYAPLETTLGPSLVKRIGAAGGRPTNSDMSYFNLQWGDQGVILAIGWPGQWAAEFARDAGDGLRVRAGQELVHLKLNPGEEVRSPLAVVEFWRGGDWIRAQNTWRQWFIAHNIRRPGGRLPPIQWCGASETGTELMTQATEENQKRFLAAYLQRGLKPDFWWMDAGWYPCQGKWWNTGTWEFDKARFPRGLRPVTDELHAHGVRAILWFEPERVTPGSWLASQHPEWVFGGKAGGLLNLGHPQAWHWLVNHIDRLVTDAGIDIYRQDFNIDPLPFWRASDAVDRKGITENRYVTALLAYWDELLRRHPNMLYDNCASGGRRNDLESMRRGVPYTKSDYADDPVGVQGQTYGISMWLPYYAATWGSSDDPYLCRSRMAPVIGACLDLRQKDHLRQLPQRLEEWRKTVPCYWGDFWPLSPYSLDAKAWMAWQFDLPESGRGVVQAFRRAESPMGSACYKLRGLDPAARYRCIDLDRAGSTEFTGRELMDRGLKIAIAQKPGAAIITYERTQ